MKRKLLFPLVIVLMVGLVFSGCAKPAPAPAPAPAPTPGQTITPKPSAPAPAPAPAPTKVFKLKFIQKFWIISSVSETLKECFCKKLFLGF